MKNSKNSSFTLEGISSYLYFNLDIDEIEAQLQTIPSRIHDIFLDSLAGLCTKNIDILESNNAINGDDSMIFGSQELTGSKDVESSILALQKISEILMLYVSQQVKYKSDKLSELASLLHNILIPLDENINHAVDLKKIIAKCCEGLWHNDAVGAENLITQLLPYLLLISLSPFATEVDVKRVSALHEALNLLDFEDESIDSLRGLLLRSFLSPLFLKSLDGKKFLVHLILLGNGWY